MRLRGLLPVLFVLLLVAAVPRGGAAHEGQLTWAVHVSLAPTWFDPAEAPGIITPYMIFYALHDAVAKPMPGEAGAASKTLKERVAGVDTPDARHVRIRLKQPWPDFLTFYTSATGAGWVVPKKYVEKVGGQGFKKAPIGAGPYRFVSFTPGVELVLEAFGQYWR